MKAGKGRVKTKFFPPTKVLGLHDLSEHRNSEQVKGVFSLPEPGFLIPHVL